MNEINVQYEIRDNKRPLILAGIILILIIMIVTSILVYFLTDKQISKIVLWVLFSLIIFIGLCMIFYTEYQRRQANIRKRQASQVQTIPPGGSNRGWIRSMSTLEAQYIQPTPSAPKLSVASSGWALNPRKWSVATTAFVSNTPQPISERVI